MMVNDSKEIVVFHHFDNAMDANIAKSKLDAYGIPCFLTEENMANLYPGQNLYVFQIRLHLFAADRERATQILGHNSLSIDQESAVSCPTCSSIQVTRGFPKKMADTLLVIFFGVFLPHKKVNHCMKCGLEF